MPDTAVALVVDDDALVRKTVVEMLERHSFTVVQAEGVADAVRIADENQGRIDLLIANHSLRDGTGQDAAHHVTEKWPRSGCYGIRVIRRDTCRRKGRCQRKPPSSRSHFVPMSF